MGVVARAWGTHPQSGQGSLRKGRQWGWRIAQVPVCLEAQVCLEALVWELGGTGCMGAGPSSSVKAEELPLTFSTGFLATLAQLCISNEASPAPSEGVVWGRWSRPSGGCSLLL